MLRAIAILVGAATIGAATHAAILAAGGYSAPGAPLQMAVAASVVVGSVAIGVAWRESRWAVLLALVAALAAGEAYAVMLTAERTIAAREAAVSPAKASADARQAAEARLRRAEAAKSVADAAILGEASKAGCKVECRRLLEGAMESARTELDAARTSLAASPAPMSASPLADRLGIPAWAWDLTQAALASIAANFMGAALVAFGAHGARPPRVATIEIVEPARQLPPSPREHAAAFARQTLIPATDETSMLTVFEAYRAWCASRGEPALPAREIGKALLDLFDRLRLPVAVVDGTPHVRGARLKI